MIYSVYDVETNELCAQFIHKEITNIPLLEHKARQALSKNEYGNGKGCRYEVFKALNMNHSISKLVTTFEMGMYR